MSDSRRSNSVYSSRRCARCEADLRAERVYGASGVTYLWRCSCGWASARTVGAAAEEQTSRRIKQSGVVVRTADDSAPGRRASSGEDA